MKVPLIQKPLTVALVTAAAVRLSLMIIAFMITGTAVITQGDTQSYLIPGHNLIRHDSYTNNGIPEIDRTPGYPLFLMLSGMAANNVLLSVTAQIAISLLSLLLVARIAGSVFADSRAPLIAAWLYAVEPLSILYTARLMPETVFVCLTLAMIDCLIAFQKKGSLRSLAVAGVLLAVATYIRPVAYYLVIPIAAALALGPHKIRSHAWKAPAILLMTTLPLLAVWQVRNAVETGYRGFSSIVEKNLYFYQSAAITAEIDHISLDSEQRRLGYPDEVSYVAAHPEQQHWSQEQRLTYMRTQSMLILGQHRWRYIRSHVAGVAVVTFTPCASEWLQLLGIYPDQGSMPHRILNEGIIASTLRVAADHPGVIAAMCLLEGALLTMYALALMGMFADNQTRPSILLLCGIALYFLLISGGAQAVGRYRLPAIPEVCILAAGGIASLQKSKVRPAQKRESHSAS